MSIICKAARDMRSSKWFPRLQKRVKIGLAACLRPEMLTTYGNIRLLARKMSTSVNGDFRFSLWKVYRQFKAGRKRGI